MPNQQTGTNSSESGPRTRQMEGREGENAMQLMFQWHFSTPSNYAFWEFRGNGLSLRSSFFGIDNVETLLKGWMKWVQESVIPLGIIIKFAPYLTFIFTLHKVKCDRYVHHHWVMMRINEIIQKFVLEINAALLEWPAIISLLDLNIWVKNLTSLCNIIWISDNRIMLNVCHVERCIARMGSC